MKLTNIEALNEKEAKKSFGLSGHYPTKKNVSRLMS